MRSSGLYANNKESFTDIREIVAEACPNPEPAIVQRLKDDWKRTDWGIRFPWQSAPRTSYYDEKDVMFFARILTMLQYFGVYPPARLTAQGGGSTSSTSFDGPIEITPNEPTSRPYLTVATTEDEVKRNTFSQERGGLADAARNQLREIFTFGRNQVNELVNAVGRLSRRMDRTTETPPDIPIEYLPGYEDIDTRTLNDDQKMLLRTPPQDFADQFTQALDQNHPVQNRFDTRRSEIIRKVRILYENIYRRFVWSLLSEEKKAKYRNTIDRTVQEIELEETKAEEEDPEEDTPLLPDSAPRDLPPRVFIRWNLLVRVARFLLIPMSAIVAGVTLYQNRSSEPEDELVRLFLALPEDHWFRQLPLRSWVKLIILTPRQQNYLLLQQVTNKDLLHFTEDVNILWWIDNLMFQQQSKNDEAVAFFEVIKRDVTYRTEHSKDLNSIVKVQTQLLRPFEVCYVARGSDPSGLQVLAAFFQAKLVPSTQLRSIAANSQKLLNVERLTPRRQENFRNLIEAFQLDVEQSKHEFKSEWTTAMMRLYKLSMFYKTLDERAFVNVLQELSVNSQLYPTDAKLIVSDFLRRYTTKTGGSFEHTLPFQQNVTALKNDNDIYVPTKQLLDAMRMYRNDQKMDALAYEVLMQHWEQHKAITEFKTLDDAVASFNLSTRTKIALFSLIGAVQNGLLPFIDAVQRDFASQKKTDGVVQTLPSVGLVLDGPPQTEDEIEQASSTRQTNNVISTSPASRHILSNTDVALDYKTVPFFRFQNLVLLQLGLVTVVMAANDGTMNMVTLHDNNNDHDDNYAVEVWQKPTETSNAGALVLSNTSSSWSNQIMDVVIGATFVMVGFMIATENHIGPEVAGVVIASGGKALIAATSSIVTSLSAKVAAASTYTKLVALGAASAGGTAYVYREEIKEVVSSATSLIPLVIGAAVLVSLSNVYVASSKRARLQ